MVGKLPAVLAAIGLLLPGEASAQNAALPGGAQWVADVPPGWNGTLLLFSRGYSIRTGQPESAPPNVKQALLAQGYALAASDYGSAGWALEQAVPAQTAVLAAFAAAHGKPRRTIAWGTSMGGLVTTALAEQSAPRIDGGIALCASIGGSVGMMNMALDGAQAFRTLVAPDAGIELTGIKDDRANGERVSAALARAMQGPEGRARVLLAGVLAGVPGWTSPGKPQPAPDDAEAQVSEIARGFVMGVFLPRSDQEARAGVGYSWTSGVDYRRQLALSGRRSLVEALYRKAGLDLAADLDRLNNAPRLAAVPAAKAYMLRNYTPSARPRVPLLAVQAVGDGATSPSLQQGYADAAPARQFASLWLEQAGHCNFTPAQVLASIHHLEQRLDSGRWSARPAGFANYSAPPMLRPCWRGRQCR